MGTSSSSPADPDYWPPVHREIALTLDDVLLEDGKIAPFSRTETNYVAMGRFGTLLLVGGQPDLSVAAQRGEVIRFYLTNTANTRVFNVALPGAQMKLVGGDSGRFEREEFVDSVILAPSERIVIDALFEKPGKLTLEHQTPGRTYTLATIDVAASQPSPRLPSSSPCSVTIQNGWQSGSGWRPTSTRRRTRRSGWSPRWTWPSPTALSSTPAQCTQTSLARSPIIARSAG